MKSGRGYGRVGKATQPWRSSNRGNRSTPRLIQDRCTGCGICVYACSAKAITVDGFATIRPGRCRGCGDCVATCPQQALRLEAGPSVAARGAAG